MVTIEDKFYSVEQISRKLGITSHKVYQDISKGNLAVVRIGRIIRITEKELTKYLNKEVSY